MTEFRPGDESRPQEERPGGGPAGDAGAAPAPWDSGAPRPGPGPGDPGTPGAFPPAPPAPPPGPYAAPPPDGTPPGPYGTPPGPYGHPGGAVPWRSGPDDTTWAVLAHVLGIFFSFVPPLVVLLARGRTSGFVRDQAVEALNFQITVIGAYIVSVLLIVLVIGLVMTLAVGITSVILAILASMAASRGEAYRYPINLRLVR